MHYTVYIIVSFYVIKKRGNKSKLRTFISSVDAHADGSRRITNEKTHDWFVLYK